MIHSSQIYVTKFLRLNDLLYSLEHGGQAEFPSLICRDEVDFRHSAELIVLINPESGFGEHHVLTRLLLGAATPTILGVAISKL
jgi:hypothetical protein